MAKFNWADFIKALMEKYNKSKGKDKPKVSPVSPENEILPLLNVLWENSDSVPGKSYVKLPIGLSAKQITVNDVKGTDLLIWRDGTQIWYFPTTTFSFKYPAIVSVISVENKEYQTIYNTNPDTSKHKPKPTPHPEPKPDERHVTKTPRPSPVAGHVIEKHSWYRGKTNGNRDTFYFKSNMNQYPRTFKLFAGNNVWVVKNNGKRDQQRLFLVKQSDVGGRGMAVLTNNKYNVNTAYIQYRR